MYSSYLTTTTIKRLDLKTHFLYNMYIFFLLINSGLTLLEPIIFYPKRIVTFSLLFFPPEQFSLFKTNV